MFLIIMGEEILVKVVINVLDLFCVGLGLCINWWKFCGYWKIRNIIDCLCGLIIWVLYGLREKLLIRC